MAQSYVSAKSKILSRVSDFASTPGLKPVNLVKDVEVFKDKYNDLGKPYNVGTLPGNYETDLINQIGVAIYCTENQHNIPDGDTDLFEVYFRDGLASNHNNVLKNIEHIDTDDTEKEDQLKSAVILLNELWSWDNLSDEHKNYLHGQIKELEVITDPWAINKKWDSVVKHIDQQRPGNGYFNAQQHHNEQPSYFSALNQPPINLFTSWQAAWEKALNDWRKNVPILPGVPTPPGLHPELPSNPFEMVGPVLVAFATGQPLDYGNQLKLRTLLFKNVNLV